MFMKGFLLSMAGTALLCFPAKAAEQTAFIDEIPDFLQISVAGILPGNGSQYCAPAAVANSFAWISGRQENIKSIVKTLATAGYMDTSLNNGTDVIGVMNGADRYAKKHMDGYRSMEYYGWRPYPSRLSGHNAPPALDWIIDGARQNAALWLNIGWYEKVGADYRRIGGHWATLVGYQDAGQTLILHDPSPRAGTTFENEYVEISVIDQGSLTGNNRGLPVSAAGYISLEKGMHIKTNADLAIIDGAVKMEF